MYQWAVYHAKEFSEVVDKNYLGGVVADTLEDAIGLSSVKYGLDSWSVLPIKDQRVDPDDLRILRHSRNWRRCG